jgi:hypothetical protein
VTGAASLAFRNEEHFLHHVPEQALDACQINLLMPLKRELDDEYLARATFLSDLGVLFRTVWDSHETADTERICELQGSLVSLSQALGQSQAPVSAAQSSLKLTIRDMTAR